MAGKVTDDRGASGTSNMEVTGEDVFNEAFDQAEESSGSGEQSVLNATDDSPKAETGEKDGKKEEKVKVSETKPELKSDEKIAVAAKLPGESEEKYEQRYKTLQGMFKKDKDTWESERLKLLAQIEASKKPTEIVKSIDAKSSEKPLTDKQAADLYESLSPEDKEELENYEVTWDVVSKMEGLKRKAELGRLAQSLKEEIRNEYKSEIDAIKSQLSPITIRAAEDDEAAHFDFIRSAHEDFENYREGAEGHIDLVSWIESKPRYLQPALFETIQKGKADAVVELLNDFKRESNIPIASQSRETNIVTMTPKKAEKKAALASVTSRRGSISTGFQIKDDYEGAFDEAVNKG